MPTAHPRQLTLSHAAKPPADPPRWLLTPGAGFEALAPAGSGAEIRRQALGTAAS